MFYLEDVVEVKHGLQTLNAVVTRSWVDEQDPLVAEEALKLGIPFLPLPPGQLEILYSSGIRTEISESLCTIIDRGFLSGDIIKSSTMNTHQSGVIIDLHTEVGLCRVLSGEILDDVYDVKLLVAHARISRGDHVISFNNLWLGLVEEVFEMAMVETSSHLRRICDVGNTLSVGTSADSLLFDQNIPASAPSSPGIRRVREVRQVACAVNWICMNQSLESEAQTTTESRPKRYWSNEEIRQLSLVRATADHLHSIGDKVVFRDLNSNPPSPTATPLNNFSGEHVLYVTSSRSKASVLWQDGTTTHDISTPLLEHYNELSDDDAFPGEVGIFTPSNKVAVVQKVNKKQRTLSIRIYESEEILEISTIDFDLRGTPEYPFGVRRQEFVLVSKKDTGVPCPAVPNLGESEILTGSFPSPEMLREEISAIGLIAVNNITDDNSLPQNGHGIEWYGEVVELQLDGRALIKYPSGKTESIPLSRLYHVDDGLNPDGPDFGDEDYLSDEDMSIEGSEWSDEREGEVYQTDAYVIETGWADESVVLNHNNLDAPVPVVDNLVLTDDNSPTPIDPVENENWRGFVILEEPPLDHYYLKEPTTVPPKAYMSRIKKEYDVFSSLPANILVRAYENRSDLLRVLIIGPSGTPFTNAPFLFDIFLPPTTFPVGPPKVFFHSWCGNTKCSPNLYTDGKVCLSLLNTWPGDQVETWSAARSSILQILISIQSLIMVEAPYFTEPGFEKSQDTVDGQIASNLYSERTYVLTRMFVKRACEFPPLDFEKEVKAFYFDGISKNNLGVLKVVVEEAQALLEESEEKEGREESQILVGQSVLTEGACLSLKRIVGSLVDLVVPS